MCGRYTQTRSGDAIAQAFDLSAVPDLPPRYNIAPTQPVGAIVQQ
ncbi:MAG: SOS response-associated peptidase family protein, partial [Cyanobacteria bacterium J06588_5]